MTVGTISTLEVEPLRIADRTFASRLILGTGKYPDAETMKLSLEASGTEMVTVALRRVNLERADDGHGVRDRGSRLRVGGVLLELSPNPPPASGKRHAGRSIHASQTMSLPALEPIRDEDVLDFCRFLTEHLSGERTAEQWAQAFRQRWCPDKPNNGFVIRQDGRIVGGIGAIYAQRRIRGNVERWTREWSKHGPDHGDQADNLKISFCERYWG